MTDEELIARLRDNNFDDAADRLTALLARAEAAEAQEAFAQAALTTMAKEWQADIAALAAMTSERDAERETVARLTAALRKAQEGLNWAKAHLSTRGVESVAVNEADAATYAALTEAQKEPTDG